MDWIHCNKCFYIKTPGNGIQIFCGSCCHIICKNCLQTKCPVCDKQFNYTEITNKIIPKAPNVAQSYFEDLNMCRQNLQKRGKFQWEQRTRLENHQIKIFNEIKKEKNEIIELQKLEKLFKAEIKEDLRKIKQCKNFIKKIRSSSVSGKTNSKYSSDQLSRKDDSGVISFRSSWL